MDRNDKVSELEVLDLVENFVDAAFGNLREEGISSYDFERNVVDEVMEKAGIDKGLVEKLYSPCVHWGVFCGNFSGAVFEEVENRPYSGFQVRKSSEIDWNSKQTLKLEIFSEYKECIASKINLYSESL